MFKPWVDLVKGCFEDPNSERRRNSELGNDNSLRGVKDTECLVQPPSNTRLPEEGNKCQADDERRDDYEQVNDCVNEDSEPNWVAGKGISSRCTYQDNEKGCDSSGYDTFSGLTPLLPQLTSRITLYGSRS